MESTSVAEQEQTQEPAEELDIEAQLDALMAQIENEQLGQDAPAVAAVAAPATDTPAAEPAETASAADASETVGNDAMADMFASASAADSPDTPDAAAPAVAEEAAPAADASETVGNDAMAEMFASAGLAESPVTPEPTAPPVAAEAVPAEGAGDEDPLANQIQQLLNQAKSDAQPPAAAAPAEATLAVGLELDADETPQAVSAALVEEADDPLTSQIEQLLSGANQQGQKPGAALRLSDDSVLDEVPETEPPEPPKAAGAIDDAEVVAELDQILADSAADAVAGDYETIEQVLAEESAVTATSSDMVRDGETDELDLEGEFETLQQVEAQAEAEVGEPVGAGAAPPPAGGFTASAKDVARELAEELGPTPTPSEAPAARAGAGRRVRSLLARIAAGLAVVGGRVPDATYQVCVVISKPMDWVSPGTRNTIGYIGLLTLFNALAVIAYKVLSSVLGS